MAQTKARAKEYHKEKWALPEWRARKLAYAKSSKGKLAMYKNNAKRRKIEWLLGDEEAFLLFEMPCYFCGELGPGGIDRLNGGPYIPEGVVASCGICNQAKNDLQEHEFLEWARRVARHWGN